MPYSITDYERPSVAVDAAVFGVDDHKSSTMDEKILKILLVKRGEEPFKGMYALPGGFLRQAEKLNRDGTNYHVFRLTFIAETFGERKRVVDENNFKFLLGGTSLEDSAE